MLKLNQIQFSWKKFLLVTLLATFVVWEMTPNVWAQNRPLKKHKIIKVCESLLRGSPVSELLVYPRLINAERVEKWSFEIMASLESVSQLKFPDYGKKTRPFARLVLPDRPIDTPCGISQQKQPFYCPANETIYFHPGFYFRFSRRIKDRVRLAGLAYILAHEFAHHVQNQLGLLHLATSGPGSVEYLTIELMADCMAGGFLKMMMDSSCSLPIDDTDLENASHIAWCAGDDAIRELLTYPDTPNTTYRLSHGTAHMRLNSLLMGFKFGAHTCINADFSVIINRSQ